LAILFTAVPPLQATRSFDRASWSRHFNFNRNRDRATLAPFLDTVQLNDVLLEVRKIFISGALDAADGNQAKAARKIGVSRSVIEYFLRSQR
jgi:DNA-binding NtrC family response regulator